MLPFAFSARPLQFNDAIATPFSITIGLEFIGFMCISSLRNSFSLLSLVLKYLALFLDSLFRWVFLLCSIKRDIIFVLSGPLLSLLFCKICLALIDFKLCIFSATAAS